MLRPSITNVYNTYSSGMINVDQVSYANRTVAGAVTAVPGSVFVNAQPVRPAAIRLDRNAVTTGEITRVAPIAPVVRSVIGAGTAAGARPSREALERQVFVRNAPPPGERPFAAREQQLQKQPGRAPEPAAVKPVQSRDDNTAQKVRVIGEQPGAVDARAAGSRRGGGKPDRPAKQQPLDRSIEPATGPEPAPGDRSRDKEQKGQVDVPQQQAVDKKQTEKQPVERKRLAQTQQESQAECERLAIEQHQDVSQCRNMTLPKESSGNSNRGNKGR